MVKIMKKYILLLMLCLWVMLLPGHVWSQSCSNTAGCHDDLINRPVVHEPAVEDCLNCHQGEASGHPRAEGDEFSIPAGADGCFECHEKFNELPYQHGPAASGACTSCHDPHGSANRSLLKAGLQDLCLDCHGDFAESLNSARFVHSAVRELECDACHLPHASEHPALLKDDTTMICFDCHDEIADKYRRSRNRHEAMYAEKKCANCHFSHFSAHRSLLVKEGAALCLDCHGDDKSDASRGTRNIALELKGKKNIHGPVAEGNCVDCHDPHGNNYAALLRAPYPGTFYAPFKEDTYDFCFQCHDRELLAPGRESRETGFRNGDDNLHRVHVVRERKGRTCRACHATHASNGAKLINPEGIPFGDWQVPVRFEATETGGSCFPGCHRGMAYDRKKPVDNRDKTVYQKPEIRWENPKNR